VSAGPLEGLCESTSFYWLSVQRSVVFSSMAMLVSLS